MDDVTDKELSEMIADLSLTESWPDRVKLCRALIELRALRQRLRDSWMRRWTSWFSG